MMSTLRLLVACFLVASFLHGFSLLQKHLARHNYDAGVRDGFGFCIRPQGDSKVSDLEDTTARHRNELAQGIYVQSIQGVYTPKANN